MSKPLTKIIELNDLELGIIYIEVPADLPTKEGWSNISNESGIARVEGRMSEALASLQRFAKGAIGTLRDLKPDEIEIKSGVKFSVKEGKLIGLLAQAEAEFPFEITIKWKLGQSEQP